MQQYRKLLSVNELAEAISLSVPWVYARTRISLIPCVRQGAVCVLI